MTENDEKSEVLLMGGEDGGRRTKVNQSGIDWNIRTKKLRLDYLATQYRSRPSAAIEQFKLAARMHRRDLA